MDLEPFIDLCQECSVTCGYNAFRGNLHLVSEHTHTQHCAYTHFLKSCDGV